MKVGLIGYGRWGGGPVARNIARVADLAVIVDPDPVRMVKAAEDWGAWGTRVASEPEVAFDRCDAVWIATPALTHFDLTRQALGAGVHVLCEKPFVLDPVQAELLTFMAYERDLTLMVGHLSLYTEAYRKAQTYDSAVKITHISTIRKTTEPSLSDHNVVWGLAPHDVAFIWSLMGEPDAVECNGTQHRADITFLWDDERTATIEVDWLSRERQQACVVDVKMVLPSHDNHAEPLLKEAQDFTWLCFDPTLEEQEHKRREALEVTRLLDRINTDVLDLV